DSFYLGSLIFVSAGALNELPSPVTINGNGGSDSVYLDDNLNTAGASYTIGISAAGPTGGTSFLHYPTVEKLIVNAGSGNDTVTLAPFLSRLGNVPISPLVTVNGGPGTADTLIVNEMSATANIAGTVTATSISITGLSQGANISGIENVRILTGS